MSALRIIFAGSGEFGVPTLRNLVDSPGICVVQVVSQPDRPAGRGRHLQPTAIAHLALQRGLPLLRARDINVEPLPVADVMVVIAFGQKIAPHVVSQPRLGSINLHASLLPRFRGAAPVNWTIIRGEQVTGNSVIRLASRMDAGAILGQSRLEIGEVETAGALHDRLARDGVTLVARVLDELSRGVAVEAAQDESQATSAPKLTRENAMIDWSRGAASIAGQIRGTHPWPGCRVRLIDQLHHEVARMTLVRARPRGSDGAGGRAGEIDAMRHVAASDGVVEIVELQPDGKRTMSLDAFRNGHRWDPGMRLESIA